MQSVIKLTKTMKVYAATTLTYQEAEQIPDTMLNAGEPWWLGTAKYTGYNGSTGCVDAEGRPCHPTVTFLAGIRPVLLCKLEGSAMDCRIRVPKRNPLSRFYYKEFMYKGRVYVVCPVERNGYNLALSLELLKNSDGEILKIPFTDCDGETLYNGMRVLTSNGAYTLPAEASIDADGNPIDWNTIFTYEKSFLKKEYDRWAEENNIVNAEMPEKIPSEFTNNDGKNELMVLYQGGWVYFPTKRVTVDDALAEYERKCAKAGINTDNLKPVGATLRNSKGDDIDCKIYVTKKGA